MVHIQFEHIVDDISYTKVTVLLVKLNMELLASTLGRWAADRQQCDEKSSFKAWAPGAVTSDKKKKKCMCMP